MIKKNNKTVGFIYKNNQNIDKIYKNNQLIFEQGYTREDSGNVPLSTTYQAIGKNLKDYKIYGNSVQGKLPDIYQQVEYIESTGTQYIDTNLTFDNINDIKMKINVTTLPNVANTTIFGANGSFGEVLLFYGATANRNYINGTEANYSPSTNTLYDIDFNITNGNASLTINNSLVGTSTGNSLNKKCYLFGSIGNANSSSITYYASYKLYDLKITDTNNILIRHYIPCYRKNDSVIGLYDLVNNVFYINQGTGEFLKGNSIQEKLPSEYQQVEYIESTGTQYIDTGIKLNQDSKIITEIQLTNDGSQPNAMFGSRTSSTENNFECVSSSSSNVGIRIDFQNYETNRLTTQFNNEKNYILISKTLMQIGESTKRQISYTDFETPSNCYIFYVSGENIYGQKAQMKLYNFKIYQNDVLIKDFIPCYKKNNNEIGLYDLVTNTFFTNQGTGVFLKGNSIQEKLPDTYQEVEYIENTGTQYIDTGYIPDNINGYKIECEVCPTELGNRYAIISGHNATNSLSLEITNQNKARVYFLNGSLPTLDKPFGTITSNKNKIIVEYLNGFFTLTLNDETTTETVGLVGTTNESMYMFVDRLLRYTTFDKPLKMYKCKLYNNNNLIRNFVPCYRKSDNEIGLYDLVSNTFFTNSGTGTFNKGTDTPTSSVSIEIESVGDLITDTNDINYGKYKIPVIVGNTTTNIYLDEPLRKVGDYSDYIDFKNQKVFRNVIVNDDTGTQTIENSYTGTTDSSGTSISLPNIPTIKGTTIFEIDTEIQPSNMYIKYKSK